MPDPITPDPLPARAVVEFTCTGKATGRMRNELAVEMLRPMRESFHLASDEGAFHGGDASAPPPLAMFVASLTGCVMTQIRAFAKRMDVHLADLTVQTRVQWDWAAKGKVYETAPKSFEIDIAIDSDDVLERAQALVATAKRGCFIEQTLGQSNTITHRIKTADGWVAA